jgi:receptor expression-enhancing protein 5/6
MKAHDKLQENKKVIEKVLSTKNSEKNQPTPAKIKEIEHSLLGKWHEQMEIIHQKTGIEGKYVVIGLLACLLIVSIGYFERIITNLIGTIYPAYWTMKSIQSQNDDDKYWLTYWVVFAFFSLVDVFSGILMKLIPFYFILKIVFLVWLFMPNTQGCYYVYYFVIIKLFKQLEKDIDDATEKIGEYTKNIVSQGNQIIEQTMSKGKKADEPLFQFNPNKKAN